MNEYLHDEPDNCICCSPPTSGSKPYKCSFNKLCTGATACSLKPVVARRSPERAPVTWPHASISCGPKACRADVRSSEHRRSAYTRCASALTGFQPAANDVLSSVLLAGGHRKRSDVWLDDVSLRTGTLAALPAAPAPASAASPTTAAQYLCAVRDDVRGICRRHPRRALSN